MLNISYFHFNVFEVNCWVVWNDARQALVVDPGYSDAKEAGALFSFIDREGLKPEAVIITHGHVDHVLGAADFCKHYGIKAYMSPKDAEVMEIHGKVAHRFGFTFDPAALKTEPVDNGDVLTLIGEQWKAIATPGHSPGGTCWYNEKEGLLFSGDTLFKGTIGRTDLECCNYDDLIVSIMDKIMGLPGSTDVLPGHGTPTNIADERTHNPFLEPFNEPEQEGLDWDQDGIELNG